MFAYSLDIVDMAGNRLLVKKQPLARLEPEPGEAESPEEKEMIWIEDF